MTLPLEQNRAVWDMLSPIHASGAFYNVQGFLRGDSTLRVLERSLVGSCEEKDLLHLQCHFGLDSLSWARLGANVTGVDFSSVAIEKARALAEKIGQSACFVCQDVQQLQLNAQFDIAVATYGVLCWLEDLEGWASGIYRHLRPGGAFVLVEFHPILEAVWPGKMTGARSYFGSKQPNIVHTTGSYADRSAPIAYDEFRWQHPISKVISSLLKVGLEISSFQEHPYCSYGLFDELHETSPGVWYPRESAVWPYMFSIRAEKRR